ncbi:alpha-amylase family glycosyl hydrolase [Sandaracinobacteroides saxicola]|uniref:DUF3459 domain-containing protein n=1 Tax=Sandaracinobacteroides saxicola TaxID=2759707 RepID=A0A7G5IFP2_9SPHN|nr:alpha-amylase family glycosyl hydrolase [Sandaracinobacteroides saxicola]QMW22184.1 DUF3459 domain-containing protein [Sandaracinobacteroides saxicola]
MNALSRQAAPALYPASQSPWWHGATIYQVYPRSFADSNGDGIGDLPGITARLDHIASLGVDAVWISPFYPSPMHDYGYDVADYCDVAPEFGTLADFDALLTKAHGLGLRVIIDQVYAHTSWDHAWFAQSRTSRNNPRADWYVWADPKADGTPPNNWQSVFGGPAWTWDARRGQYYMHNFLNSQPQLNVHNLAVQDALLDAARFWLDRGVDGFRLDALNFAMFDPALRDNPPAPPGNRRRSRSFDFQQHKYNQSQPQILPFLERIRAVMDSYGATFTVAEIGGANPVAEMKAFTHGDARLNTAYNFAFLYAQDLSPERVVNALADWPGDAAEGWPSWAFSNHDAPRHLTRWYAGNDSAAFAKLCLLLLLSLRGNAFLYQGEELGLPQGEVAYDHLRDPEAIANWPLTLGRDGARTPMPWQVHATNAGFSSGTPWLPLDPRHAALAVDAQDADPQSVLNFARAAIALRGGHPALRRGSLGVVAARGTLLILERRHDGETLRAAFNLGDVTVALAHEPGWQPLLTLNGAEVDSASLPPLGAWIARKA